jgi:PEP-CTERM motif
VLKNRLQAVALLINMMRTVHWAPVLWGHSIMKKSILAFVAAAAACLAFSPAAYADADYSYDVTFSSGGQTETLNAMIVVSGDEIVSMTGSLDGSGFTGANSFLNGSQSIASLLANPNFPSAYTFTGVGGGTYFTFDDEFYSGSESLDDGGLVFKLTNGQYVALWGNAPNSYELFVGNWIFDGRGVGAFLVPEPPSYTVMLMGLLAFLGLFLYRRRSLGRNRALAFAV